MILLIILLLTLVFLSIIAVLAISAGGALFIVLFGDVIVCALVILWIMKKLIKRKRKR